MTAPVEQQIAAWDDYVAAKRRADVTHKFEDGRAAATAWKKFANLFLEEDRQIPVDAEYRTNLVPFPIHRTTGPTL